MEAWEGGRQPESLLHSDEKLPPPAEEIKKPRRDPPALERITENGDGGVGLEEAGWDAEQSHSDQEESSSESSDSGSSNSSTSTTGSTTSSDSQMRIPQATNSSLYQTDEYGEYVAVSCAENDARFYLNRFARGSIGRCVLFKGRWITPNEFQAVSGRQSSKDWKRSIRLKGRCLKEYISQGLFKEHPKSCACKICSGEATEHLRQEGELALQVKRRRLSQATADGGGPSVPLQEGDIPSQYVTMAAEEAPPVKRKRGRPPKVQRVWSPSGEVAQEGSSNEEEYKPSRVAAGEVEDGQTSNSVIDTSDFLPRRSRRSTNKKYIGHRTELGTFTCKPKEWDAEEVAEFLRLQGYGDYAEAFQQSEIDGQSLFLLGEQHLIERFSMKLGPALRLLDTISRLRHPPIQ